MEVLGKAMSTVLAPHDVCISGFAGRPANGTIRQADTPSIIIARADTTELARWLVVAINRLLEGQQPLGPRPTGRLIVRGCFNHGGTSVFAWHWERGGIEVAQCMDMDTAGHLAAKLDALLGTD